MRKLRKYKPTKFMAEDSVYSKELADYAVSFIECLCHTKGTWAGKPFELIDWQEQIIRDVFGTIKPNGYRQFNTAYIEIPKKMGKSELAAAVALLLTCGDGEERAEVYGCAADRQQASIVFEVAADMVRMCPALNKRVKILASQKRIVYQPTNSFYQVLSAEAYSKHGFNIHGVVFDELHTQPNRKLFDVMTKGSGDARTQPLYFLITTAGTDTNSICYETHQKAKDIIEGRKIDPTFYPVIYGADENDDWTDPEVWKKANPSLGITVSIDKVQAACDSAKQNPGEENAFRQLRLNQWVKQAVRWMPMEKWDACAFHVNEDDLEGRVCYGGLDLSSTTDITAFVLVFPPRDEDDKFAILPYFWIPEDTLELRVRRDHVPYDIWEKQGDLMTTEGNVVHYGFIEKFIERLGERFNIREIAFDRWGAVQMVLINDSSKRDAVEPSVEKRFLDFVKNDETYRECYDGMFILFKTGLRVSELSGLTLRDIDMKERTININHQLQTTGHKGKYIEETKTNAGTRILPMTEEVYEAFQRVLENRKAPKVEQIIDGYSGFLFLDRRGKAMVSYQWEKRFQRAVEKHNKENKRKLPKITPHICRHTYCTNMAKSGISPKTLQYLMGHSSIEVTMNVYTHLGLADAKREVDRLEAMKEINEKEQAGKWFRMA